MLMFDAKTLKQELQEITEEALNPIPSIVNRIVEKVLLQCKKAAKKGISWAYLDYKALDLDGINENFVQQLGKELHSRIIDMGFDEKDFHIHITPVSRTAEAFYDGLHVNIKITWGRGKHNDENAVG